MAKLKYVSKNKVYPGAFGGADVKKMVAYVRKDLPKPVRKFVGTHELYHLRDNGKNLKEINKGKKGWFWEEIKTNAYAGIRHPIGFIATIIMSLQPYRIKLYIDRFKKGY
ncbi:MAG: hypothetical protein WDZ69_02000 [Candidatus Pacearchaeota archaeon]